MALIETPSCVPVTNLPATNLCIEPLLAECEKKQSSLESQLLVVQLTIQELSARLQELRALDAETVDHSSETKMHMLTRCAEALNTAILNQGCLNKEYESIQAMQSILGAARSIKQQEIALDGCIQGLMTQIVERNRQMEAAQTEIHKLAALECQVAPLQALVEKLAMENETSQAALAAARQKCQALRTEIKNTLRKAFQSYPAEREPVLYLADF